MDPECSGHFEEYSETAPNRHALSGPIRIRPADLEDADKLGRISAEREGEEASIHITAFRRAIEGDEIGESLLVLVAEFEGEVIGFGKAKRVDSEDASPAGWYLSGVVVDPDYRRRGAGRLLTAARLKWISERSRCAYFFANARNRVSIELHERFGFQEIARGPGFAGVSFTGGEGILFRAELSRS